MIEIPTKIPLKGDEYLLERQEIKATYYCRSKGSKMVVEWVEATEDGKEVLYGFPVPQSLEIECQDLK